MSKTPIQNALPRKSMHDKENIIKRNWKSLQHFMWGKELKIVTKKDDGSYSLKNLESSELSREIDLTYTQKYTTKFTMIEPDYLRYYGYQLEADLEEWSIFSMGSIQFAQAATISYLALFIAFSAQYIGKIHDETEAEIATFLIIIGFLLIALPAGLLIIWRYRHIAKKKSKAKLFIKIIDSILANQSGK